MSAEIVVLLSLRGVFVSVKDLIRAIDEYVVGWNQDPKPFVWTASVESITEKLSRCRQTLERIKQVARFPDHAKPKKITPVVCETLH